ncbi:MAG: hypothetical protein AAGA03_16435 [Planctomycetota bacterium]
MRGELGSQWDYGSVLFWVSAVLATIGWSFTCGPSAEINGSIPVHRTQHLKTPEDFDRHDRSRAFDLGLTIGCVSAANAAWGLWLARLL